MLNKIEGLMHSVDRSNQKIRPGFCQLFRRRKHQFGHACPVVSINALHIVSEVVAVHGDFRMAVGAKQACTLETDSAVTQSGAFRAASDDADVQGHSGQWPVIRDQGSAISGQLLLN